MGGLERVQPLLRAGGHRPAAGPAAGRPARGLLPAPPPRRPLLLPACLPRYQPPRDPRCWGGSVLGASWWWAPWWGTLHPVGMGVPAVPPSHCPPQCPVAGLRGAPGPPATPSAREGCGAAAGGAPTPRPRTGASPAPGRPCRASPATCSPAGTPQVGDGGTAGGGHGVRGVMGWGCVLRAGGARGSTHPHSIPCPPRMQPRDGAGAGRGLRTGPGAPLSPSLWGPECHHELPEPLPGG